jgi:mRNA-degrading endonuclease YafQ of YafQ-DinJ toxin-antitoxin module
MHGVAKQQNIKPLPSKCRDHPLPGDWANQITTL